MTAIATGYSVRFHGCATVLRLSRFTDEAIVVARLRAERITCRRLTVDPKTDFPSFTVYRNGQEIGGG